MRAGGAGGSLAAAEDVDADDEPAVRVDALAPADEVVPPARGRVAWPGRAGGVGVAGQGVADEDRVGARGVELAPRLVGEGEAPEHSTALERERPVGQDDELPSSCGIALSPGARRWLRR